jgi:branched-chain amino acid transport system substrate-binding protein
MVKIGLLATLVGPFRVLGEDAVRGARLALAEFGYEIGGQPIEFVVQSTNAMGDPARDAAHHLIHNEQVDVIVGPLSGDEGVAIREFAKQHPGHVFANGTSGSQAIFNPAPNFHAFATNGVQWVAGLGRYCYENKGYRRVVTIGEGYSFAYAQIGGFGFEFWRAGGQIVNMLWCGLGTQDYGHYIDQIPDDVDAVFSMLGGTDGLAFLRQFRDRGKHMPIIAGSICGDSSLLHFVRDQADLLKGVISASAVADDNPIPSWQNWADCYRAAYPDGFYSPSLFAYAYYVNMKAVLLALTQVEGDLSDGQARLKAALAQLEFDAPAGRVRLDHHRVAIADNFVSEIDVKPDGTLYTRLLKRLPEVNCTLGMPDDEYMKIGRFDPNHMPWQQSAANPLLERVAQLKRQRQIAT